MTVTLLPISLTLAAVAALLNFWLSFRVGQVRGRENVHVGDGGNEHVIRRMRAHGNYVENTPFVLILIALIELAGGHQTALWAIGGLFFLGRVAHAFGMDGFRPGRMIGAITALLAQLGLAIWGLALLWG